MLGQVTILVVICPSSLFIRLRKKLPDDEEGGDKVPDEKSARKNIHCLAYTWMNSGIGW